MWMEKIRKEVELVDKEVKRITQKALREERGYKRSQSALTSSC